MRESTQQVSVVAFDPTHLDIQRFHFIVEFSENYITEKQQQQREMAFFVIKSRSGVGS